MTLREQTSPAPTPTAIFSPVSPAPPTVSALPLPPGRSSSAAGGSKTIIPSSAEDPGNAKKGKHHHDDIEEDSSFPQPKLRLEIRDLNHPGAAKFLGSVNAGNVVSDAVANVQRLLYGSPKDRHTTVPPTRSVTLVLRDMDGVAYTTGTDLDDDHKEIHLSLRYINDISTPRLTSEVTGVLTHELVHCYQWNAKGTCPGGLIEGIADWVRLNCDLSPPHWKRETSGKWDGGYQHTAYFLEYLEGRFGEGTVRKVNEKLRLHKYEPKPFWTELLGRPVEQLWGDYVENVTGEALKC